MSTGTSRTEFRPAKRARPPNLTLGAKSLKFPAARSIAIETVTPVENGEEEQDVEAEEWLSPSSGTSSPLGESASTGSDSELSDDLSKNLERLEKLRQNVHRNLRLRPLRSATLPPDSPALAAHATRFDTTTASGSQQHRPDSPFSTTGSSAAPSPAFSVYYTPTTEFMDLPTSARFIGNGQPSSSSSSNVNTPLSRDHHHYRGISSPPVADSPLAFSPRPAQGIDPDALFTRLSASRRPLLIDTRPTASYLSTRIQHSLNIAIPSLMLRRSTKQGGGFGSLDALRTYITTDRGKCEWDEMTKGNGPWDGDIVIYDEEMDDKNRDNLQILSWAIISLLRPLAGIGTVDFLKGGTKAAFACESARDYIMTGEEDLPAPSEPSDLRRSDDSPRKGGLFQLDTLTAARSKLMPDIEAPSSSPGPLLSSSAHNMLCDLSPSPSPSRCVFPHYAKHRKGSVPSLRRLDTTSAERLVPKLTLRTLPMKSNTLAAPLSVARRSSASSLRSHSPSLLNLPQPTKRHASLSPPSTSGSSGSLSPNPAYTSLPHSPNTPVGPSSSPATARPEVDQPPTTEDPLPSFTVSCILPNFLYLGPEPSSPEHVDELLSLGVKRILNIAIECDDDQGLGLRKKFERYTRIPMRDIVEEDNVSYSVREACEALDDARLHSAPTYVHCKAGKSRSVTAVIAYLIHANHWTLSRAYAFVTERRKGISPNIGFVSELMSFEEQELGGKSVGVVNNAMNGGDTEEHAKSYAPGPRRAANLRESLPPILATQTSEMIMPGLHSAGGLLGSNNVARVGDVGQEVEIKDASGRYRHARRAPVDENTLQPMRRVSKAGLESISYLSASDL